MMGKYPFLVVKYLRGDRITVHVLSIYIHGNTITTEIFDKDVEDQKMRKIK